MSTNPDEDRTWLSQPDTAFLTKARIADWETDKTFSTDWAGNHFFYWAELLDRLREKPVRILEIGSWEGRSALFFLNYLPLSRIVCIDPFEGNVEHQIDPYFRELALKSEAQFDRNLAGFCGSRRKDQRQLDDGPAGTRHCRSPVRPRLYRRQSHGRRRV